MTVIARTKKNYQVEIKAGNHTFISDEPLGFGDDLGPDPYSLMLGALGACTVITLHMYAKQKNYPLESVEIKLDTFSIHAEDCVDCYSKPDAKVNIIEREIILHGPLTPKQRQRMLEIVDMCPLHKTLIGEIKIRNRTGPVPLGIDLANPPEQNS